MGLVITLINAIVTVLTYTVIIYTLLRFIMDPYHPVVSALGVVVEPLLTPIRKRVLPMGGLDFSPLVLILGLQIMGMIVVAILRSLV